MSYRYSDNLPVANNPDEIQVHLGEITEASPNDGMTFGIIKLVEGDETLLQFGVTQEVLSSLMTKLVLLSREMSGQ